MVSDLKNKLMRHVTFTHYISGLLKDLFFNSVHFFMDSKSQRVFFPKTPKLCVSHTEVSTCYNFKFGMSFSTVSHKIGNAG